MRLYGKNLLNARHKALATALKMSLTHWAAPRIAGLLCVTAILLQPFPSSLAMLSAADYRYTHITSV